MKTTLTLNVGSSSIKYALFKDHELLTRGSKDRIRTKADRVQALAHILESLPCKPSIIAHRIVHGGTIAKHQRVTPALLKRLHNIADLAPLHDIPEIEVIEACNRRYKHIRQVAIFDTVFHQTMPKSAAMYGLPYHYFTAGIRRYGFHGISHAYASRGLKGNVITCHLGNGCSLAAIKDGKSIDTSMGLTPLEGVIMGTRSGTIDPAIIPYLVQHHHLNVAQISSLLNKESGLLGISGISSDMRDLLKSKNSRAKLAIDVFVYQITKQIGAYTAALNGVNHIVFTGGIGENSAYIRSRILSSLTYLGVALDTKANARNAPIISKRNTPITIHIVPANEELAMAQAAQRL